jgi:hypothetical protein
VIYLFVDNIEKSFKKNNMNKNLKIALGIAVGVGLIYLGYQYLYKGKAPKGTDTTKENIVYDKATREITLVENN